MRMFRVEPREVYGVQVQVAVIPHPSGVNHFWNKASNRKEARRFLRDVTSYEKNTE